MSTALLLEPEEFGAAEELAALEAELRQRSWEEPLSFIELFEEFRAASWSAWKRLVLARINRELRELYVIAGRGSGKSRIVAVIASCFAVRRYARVPGERIYIGVFAPDRKQAGITFRYVVGLLRSVPELAALIEREARESIDLTNGVTVEVLTASKTAARSRAYALAVVEEAAFLPQEDSADPDVELIRSLRPALARVKNSLLVVVSSPYARRGILWDVWKRQASPASQEDPSVVLIHAPTLELNPNFDEQAIAKAREEDPAAAATEYDAVFRVDVESYVTREAVEACIVSGRFEQTPRHEVQYTAFVDPSGGRVDSMALAIGHVEHERPSLDLLVERRSPFSPEEVVKDFAATLLRYRVSSVSGDHYAGEWPVEMFRKSGIEYLPAPAPKSELYKDALPLLNSRSVELLDSPRLTEQLVGLERRTGRGGRDSIDHAPGGHDDVANVACGLLAELASQAGCPKFEVWS